MKTLLAPDPIVIYTLLPVLSVLLLYLSWRDRIRSEMGLAAALLALSLLMGHVIRLQVYGVLFALLFLGIGFFPWILRLEVQRARMGYRLRKKILRGEITRYKSRLEQTRSIRGKLLGGLNKIMRRYDFARTLVAQVEERPMLEELGAIFGEREGLRGSAFWLLADPPGGQPKNPGRSPAFRSGRLEEEDWKSCLEELDFSRGLQGHFALSPAAARRLGAPEEETLHLVYLPVKWGGQTQGLLTFALEREVPKYFFEDATVYGQLLGMGLHKAALYRLITERSRRDGLTGLYLRRVFLERLNEEINLSRRYGNSFSLFMLDIDHFKSVNDRYGHPAGDRVLQAVADCLRTTIHPGATICRYGGEEFAVLIGLVPAREAVQVAAQLRHRIESLSIPILPAAEKSEAGDQDPGESIRVTVSIGVAHYLPEAPPAEELIQRADQALYRAKEGGRNRVAEWGKE